MDVNEELKFFGKFKKKKSGRGVLLKIIWSKCFMSYFVFFCWLFICKL